MHIYTYVRAYDVLCTAHTRGASTIHIMYPVLRYAAGCVYLWSPLLFCIPHPAVSSSHAQTCEYEHVNTSTTHTGIFRLTRSVLLMDFRL